MATDIKDITVVGLGYVGLPTAALLARAGYLVHGVDANPNIVDALNRNECPLGEREVRTIVLEALESGQLHASVDPRPADAFIICVPTPVRDDRTADLSMVRAAIQSVAPVASKGALIILESTSPIGATRDVIASELAAVGLDPQIDVDVCYCPERVFPGATVREILHNDRVVGGLTPRAAERAKALYQSFCQGAPVTTTAETAEFSKLMENTFRDVNIALANVFARIAEQAGVDVHEVIKLANRHPRVNVHTPGPGVGGHCIPVDPWFLIERYPEVCALLRLSRDINDSQSTRLLDRLEDAGLTRGGRVAILGAAYRGDLDDAREAPTASLIPELARRGYEWIVHDPLVGHMHLAGGLDANLTSDLSAALVGVDAAIVMTDHSSYRALSPDRFGLMRGRLIADGRRMLHAQSFLDAGFALVAVGVGVEPLGQTAPTAL